VHKRRAANPLPVAMFQNALSRLKVAVAGWPDRPPGHDHVGFPPVMSVLRC